MLGRNEKNPRPARSGAEGVATVVATVVGVALLVLLVVCLPQFVADYMAVRTENETLRTENRDLSADLEAAKGDVPANPEEDQFAMDDWGIMKPFYVIAVIDVTADVAVDGDTMDLVVRARIYNDTSIALDETDLPAIMFNNQEYRGSLTTDTIRAHHGQGTIVWEIADVPVNSTPASLRWNMFYTIYFGEKITDAVNGRIATVLERQQEQSGTTEDAGDAGAQAGEEVQQEGERVAVGQ